MTVCELLDVIDYNRESEREKIQIVRIESDWDEVDEVLTSSALLVPIYSAKITCMEAVAENVIRIDIDWHELDSSMKIFGWAKEEKNERND